MRPPPQDPGEALYTDVFSVLAPYADYQQPEFDRATNLTPIEWLYAATSVALGSFLIAFLQELGKKTASEVAEYVKKLKAVKHNDESSRSVSRLFTSEVVVAVVSVTESAGEDALNRSLQKVAITLKELRFPEEVASEVAGRIRNEVKDAIAIHLGTSPKQD